MHLVQICSTTRQLQTEVYPDISHLPQ